VPSGAAACPWLPTLAVAAEKKQTKACIVLWMAGGPSQTDTWDLKPGHKNGGPSKEIATPVPGLRISEHLPNLAAAAKDLGIIRSMSSKEGEHGRATQLLHTGQLPNDAVAYPALGSLFAKELGDPKPRPAKLRHRIAPGRTRKPWGRLSWPAIRADGRFRDQ